MASPATARVQEPNGVARPQIDMRAALLLAAQLLAFVYGYGQLKASVDDLKDRVQQIEQDVRVMRPTK